MEKSERKLMLMTDEQEREYERLKILIQQDSWQSNYAVGQLLVVLGILTSEEAKRRFF